MLKPDYIAPVVLYLCHENCDSNGNVVECGAGWVAQGKTSQGQNPEKNSLSKMEQKIIYIILVIIS